MKRSLAIILVLLLSIGVLAGCGPDKEKIQKDFLAILENPASEETIKEAGNYLDKNLSKVTEEYASQMVHQYEHYILNFNQEGINYEEWASKYKKHLSPALAGFYQIMAEEQKSPMTDDTVLRLSWKELVEKTSRIEQFLRENKEYEPIRDDLIWIYGNYMNALVMGTNGTPIFDYKTHEFSEEARSAYSAFINQSPDTVTAWALKEYFTYLDSIEYTMNYNDKKTSKVFFDTCDWLVSESGKRVFQ